MWWYGGHGGWGGWVAMTVAMLAFWSILIAAIVVIAKAWRGGDGASSGGTTREPSDGTTREPEDALRVLDERFARGEIEAEEYTARRDLLLHR